MNNEQIARRFNRMASLMEIRGEDTFRIRSYRMAAEAIETWPTPMKEIAKKEGAAGIGGRFPMSVKRWLNSPIVRARQL